MVVYSNPDGSYPKARDLGLRDFYHDESGKYVGDPVFIPLKYKGKEQEYFAQENKRKYGEDHVAEVPKYNPNQEYQLENEVGAENLSWGRYHHAARCEWNNKMEAWIENS